MYKIYIIYKNFETQKKVIRTIRKSTCCNRIPKLKHFLFFAYLKIINKKFYAQIHSHNHCAKIFPNFQTTLFLKQSENCVKTIFMT